MRPKVLVIILGMALVTFFTRFFLIGLSRKFRFSDFWLSWLRYIPIAVLTTLIIPAILMPRGQLDVSFKNDHLIAGVIAVVLAYKTRNVILTIGSGIGIILLLRLVLQMT